MLGSLTSQLRKKCLSALCKICGRHGLLPRSLQIPTCYDRSEDPLRGGGYADVWMGEYQDRKVAVKVLRVYSTSNLAKIKNVGPAQGWSRVCSGGTDCDCVEILQRGCNMEEPQPPERAPAVGSDNERQPLRNGIRMDDKRKHQ